MTEPDTDTGFKGCRFIDYTEYVEYFREFTLNELDPDEITLSICMIAIVQNPENLDYVPDEYLEQLENPDIILSDALWTQEIVDRWYAISPLLLILFPNEYITESMQNAFDDAMTTLDSLPTGLS